MAYMDTHYGHHSDISDIDCYSRDRVLTAAMDNQVIFWKINEDSELLYLNRLHTVDTLNMINSQFYITGSSDNAIDLWTMNKKKPVYSLEGLHKGDSWVLSTAAMRNSNLFASGSYDGQVICYEFRRDKRDFGVLGRFKNLPGCINAMKFSHAKSSGDFMQSQGHSQRFMLAVTHSKEEKHGRWHVQKGAKTGVTLLARKTTEQ